jgi:hypothetical protein
MSEFKPGDLVEVVHDAYYGPGWMEKQVGAGYQEKVLPQVKQVMMVTRIVTLADSKRYTREVVEVLYEGETWTLPVIYLRHVGE